MYYGFRYSADISFAIPLGTSRNASGDIPGAFLVSKPCYNLAMKMFGIKSDRGTDRKVEKSCR